MTSLPLLQTLTDSIRAPAYRLPAFWRVMEGPLLISILATLLISIIMGDPLRAYMLSVIEIIAQMMATNTQDPEFASLWNDPVRSFRIAQEATDLMILWFVIEIASIPFCIRWYHTLLEVPPITKLHMTYFKFRLLLGIIPLIFGPDLLKILLVPFGKIGSLIYLLLFMVGISVLLRLAMVFPALCRGHPIRLRQAWRLSTGAGGTLLLIQIALLIPMLFFSFLPLMIVHSMSNLFSWLITERILLLSVSALLLFIWHGLSIAGLATCYQRLIKNAPPGVISNQHS